MTHAISSITTRAGAAAKILVCLRLAMLAFDDSAAPIPRYCRTQQCALSAAQAMRYYLCGRINARLLLAGCSGRV